MEEEKKTAEYEDIEMEKAWLLFRNKIINNTKGYRKFKVSGSWGIYDAYKLIRRHKWYDIGRPLKEKEFYDIVRLVNKRFAEAIAGGNTIILPCKMGKLELRKELKGVHINKDGSMKITYPIDWLATLKLWFEDKEAREQKLLIRRNSKCVYRVYYDKWDATYNNKIFYDFTLNRYIKQGLKHNINNGIIDSVYGKEYSIYKHKQGS